MTVYGLVKDGSPSAALLALKPLQASAAIDPEPPDWQQIQN